jgi:hypothetical protein
MVDRDPLVIPLKAPGFQGWIMRRASGGTEPQLTATDTALSSHRWTIDWDKVTSVSIGQMPYVGGRSLCIETFRREDLRLLKPSKIMSALIWLSSLFKQPEIQLSETYFDRPLERVIEDLSRKAGRPLG